MIQTFSSTIRRKEMDAVLTCMVDEKIGPGELNTRFIQLLKEFIGCDGAVAFRSPSIALSYALKALDLPQQTPVMISALAPSWQYFALKELGYTPLVLDVAEDTGIVNAETVQNGIKAGGRLLILHETMGILPEIDEIFSLGIPIIEDISHSVGASYPRHEQDDDDRVNVKKNIRKAGTVGIFTIMGLEEFDSITAGGGAVLIAPQRKDWIVLKKYTDNASRTDILPDINSALAWVQIKEFPRNEHARKTIFTIFHRALINGKNRTFSRLDDDCSTIWSFPVVLNGSFKDAKQYAAKKDIEIQNAYSNSVISFLEESQLQNIKIAKSLSLRTVLFPLYPRLGSQSVMKIAKVLGTLP